MAYFFGLSNRYHYGRGQADGSVDLAEVMKFGSEPQRDPAVNAGGTPRTRCGSDPRGTIKPPEAHCSKCADRPSVLICLTLCSASHWRVARILLVWINLLLYIYNLLLNILTAAAY